MKSPESSTSLPLDYATELAFEMHLMRADCCLAAQELMNQGPLEATALEECALLDDALAHAHRLLQSTVKHIKQAQARRRRR